MSFHLSLNAFFAVWINSKALLIRIKRFVVLLAHLMSSAFASPCLDEFLVKLKSLFGVFESSDWVHQFEVGSAAVREEELVVWVTANALVELLNRAWEVSSLEKLVTLVLMLLSKSWVKVRKLFELLFPLFNLELGLLDVVVVVLEECLFVHVN